MSTAPILAPEFTSARNPSGSKKTVSIAAISNLNQRTNIPFSATAWNHIDTLDDADRDTLAWFHMHCLDKGLSHTQIGQILGYDRTNAGRILNGTYPLKDWSSIIGTILTYRDQVAIKPTIGGIVREPDFVPTGAGEMFWQGLDYASRGGFTLLAGPSGSGKTKTCAEWDLRNPGRMIRINAPATGGHVAMIRRLAKKLGISHRKYSTGDILLNLDNRLTSRHILVIDQGSRLIPDSRQVQAKALEVLMDINEDTGCGIVIPLTWRAVQTMGDLRYQIEQITGRAEIFRAPDPTRQQVIDIARQFGEFGQKTLTALYDLALRPGALRTVVKVLNAADRAAKKLKREAITDDLVAGAIANRFERMGNENPFDN